MPATPAVESDVFPVVIAGGGLAGLTAALHLAAAGVPPLLLDADRLWAGGRLAGGDPDTFSYQGREWSFRPEHGVHAVWGGYVNLRALLAQFDLPPLQDSPGEEWINRWGRTVRRLEAGNAVRSRWIPAPLHYLQLLFNPRILASIIPLDFLSLPGILASILLTVGLDPIAEKRALDGLRLRDFFLGWTPNLKATFTGLGANLLAAPPEAIDLGAYVAALRFYTMLRRDSWQMAYFAADAHTALIQPLLDALAARGGQVRQGATVIDLVPQADGWRVVVEDAQRGGLRSVMARHVILAVNAPAAQRLLHHSAATRPAAQALTFPAALRSTVIRLWFSAAPRPGTPGGMFTGDFVPDNFFWLHRLYPDCRAWHAHTGGSVVEVHLYGSDALLDQPEKNLLVTAAAEVQRAFPELRGSFVYGAVRRNSKVHTRFRVPTADSLHVVTPWPGIVACGDWIGADTPSLWMERAVTTALLAAGEVLRAEGRPPPPVLQPPPPELSVRLLAGLLRGGRAVLGPPLRALLRRRTRPPRPPADAG